MVDHGLTKGIVLTPCAKTLTHEGAGDILLNHVYKRFGLPDSIISDRDPRFTAKSFQELLKLLGVKSKLTTAYHPQSDGTTERFNQEIEAYIGIYCSSNPETWHQSIGTMEFTRSLHSPPFSGRTRPIQNANFLALELLEFSGDFPVIFRCRSAGLVSPTDFPTDCPPEYHQTSTESPPEMTGQHQKVRRKSTGLQRTPSRQSSLLVLLIK